MTENTPVQLKRTVSAPLLVLYGLGTMLGAGIYALIGEVTAVSGIYAPLSFLVAAVLAGLTGASFAELSSRYPKAAGGAVYVAAGFSSRRLPLVIGLLIVGSGVVSSGVMFRSFVGYAQEFGDFPKWMGFVALTVAIGGIAAWGVRISVTAVAVITAIEGSVLLLIIGLGVVSEPVPQTASSAAPFDLIAVFAGAVLAFYAFIGFEDMVNLAEEVKRPRRIVPLAILYALFVTALIYAAVVWVAVRVTPLQALSGNQAPMALIFSTVSGWSGAWVSLVAMMAVINGALVQIMMASRVLYGLSRQNLLPALFGTVNTYTRTPVHATTVVSLTIFVLALSFPLGTLAKTTSFFLLIVFTMVNLALIRVKMRGDQDGQEFEVPMVLPCLGALSAAGFAALSLYELLR